MGLFDFLSGSDEAEQAAQRNAALLNTYGQTANKAYDTYQTAGLGALGTGQAGALSSIATGLSGAKDAYGNAITTLQGVSTDPLQAAINSFSSGASNAATGTAGALEAGQGGVNTLRDLGASYQPAIDAYYAALGLKGTDAAAASRANFLPGTGYDWQQEQAAKQTLARASQLGIGQSGNTAAALVQRSSDIAGTQWQDYLNRLQGFVTPQLQAGTALAGAYGTLGQLGIGAVNAQLPWATGTANAYQNLFTGGRGISGDVAGAYDKIAAATGASGAQGAGVYTGYGQDVANVYGNVASGKTQTARDIAQGNIASNNQIAQSAQADAANYWNTIGSSIKAAGTAYASDRRVKNSIRQVGALFDGTPVYAFRYNGHPAMQIGLMAQDIEKSRPHAVIEIEGVKHVDYDLATRGVGE
jgi:hypothetical protein